MQEKNWALKLWLLIPAGDIGMKKGKRRGNGQKKCLVYWQSMRKQKYPSGYGISSSSGINLATTVTDVKRMLDEVNHPNLKAMIDTTAMGVAGESIDQWFEFLGEDIIHMHFY